jgi:oxygen-independent coproporphyrinogen-3 oxidase
MHLIHKCLTKGRYWALTGTWGRFTFNPGPPQSHEGSFLPDEVGLYVHIPFCRTLCSFCPYTKILYSHRTANSYLDCLESEAKGLISRLSGSKVSSLYFGGGTPLTLPEAIESVIELMSPYMVLGAGIGVEVHPNDVSTQAVQWLRQVGVTMVSLGIESFDDDVLRILGRGYDSKAAHAAIETVMDAGFHTVNVDLMTCIPGQALEQTVADFEELLRYNVGQVSAYPLMDFSFTWPASTYSCKDQLRVLSALSAAGHVWGYDRSSVWTWTRPTVTKYTSITRRCFAGLGAGAATYFDGYFGINTFDVSAYINSILQGRPPVALHSFLTPQESALYWLFWRCYEGEIDVTAPEVQRIKAFPWLARFSRMFGLLEGLSLDDTPKFSVRLTERGLHLYHFLERYYTRRYIGRLWQVCRDSPFPIKTIL